MNEKLSELAIYAGFEQEPSLSLEMLEMIIWLEAEELKVCYVSSFHVLCSAEVL